MPKVLMRIANNIVKNFLGFLYSPIKLIFFVNINYIIY